MILTYWLVFKGLVVIDYVSFDAGSQSPVIYPLLSKSSVSLTQKFRKRKVLDETENSTHLLHNLQYANEVPKRKKEIFSVQGVSHRNTSELMRTLTARCDKDAVITIEVNSF